MTTGDGALQQALNLERNYGIVDEETVVSVGGNATMSEFQAAMGLCNLRRLDEEIEKRRRLTELYNALLQDGEGLTLPRPQPGVQANYAYYPVLFGGRLTRDEACKRLKENDIYARKYFYPLVSDFECYRGRFSSAATPVAKRISGQVATLPLYADLSEADVRLICRLLLQ